MAEAARLRQRLRRLPLQMASGVNTTLSGSPVQWIVAGVLGAVLGVGTLGFSLLPQQWAPLFVLGLLAPFIMMLGNVRKLLLAAIIFDLSFQLDTYLNYQVDTEALGGLGGFNVSVTTLCLIALYALWLSEVLTKTGPLSKLRGRASLVPGLYLGFVALSLSAARDVTLASFELFLLLQMFLLYLYIASTVRTRQEVLFIVTALLIGLVLQAAIIVGTYFTRQDFAFAGISTAVAASYATDQQLRPGGTLRSPINAASYLSLLLAPALSIWLTRLGGVYKGLAALGFGLGGVALIATFSRGGWITAMVSITLVILLAWRRGWLSLKLPLIVALFLTLLLLPFHGAISERLFGDDGGSAEARGPLASLALQIIQDNPVLGVGANNFAVVIKDYVTPAFSREWLYVVHNKYLLVWAETGTGGLLAFSAFLLLTIRRGWRCWRANDRLLSPLALAFAAAIFAQMIHMAVDVFHSRPQVQSLWFIAGLVAAINAILNTKAEHVA